MLIYHIKVHPNFAGISRGNRMKVYWRENKIVGKWEMKSDSTIAFMRLNETLYEDKGGYDNNSRECLEVVDSD